MIKLDAYLMVILHKKIKILILYHLKNIKINQIKILSHMHICLDVLTQKILYML